MSRVLRFVPISEIAASAPAEPEWIWDGYLVAGTVTLLAGRPKVGKSTLVFGLMTAIAEGRDFCGRRTRASRVVLLSEERAGTFVDKLSRTTLPQGIDVLLHQDAYDVEWPEIVRQASAHLGPGGLLVVDTLSDFAELPADAENAAGAVQSAVRPLLEAAGECAVLVVAHQRKAAGEFGEAIRGSNALTAGVDVVLELERAGSIGADSRVLKCVSRYRSGSGDQVLALGADGYEARGELAGALAEAERERIFAQLVLMDAPATAEELAERGGLAKPAAFRHLHALQEAGRVQRTGGGKRGDPFRWSQTFVLSTQDPGGQNEMARGSAGVIRAAGSAKPPRPNGTPGSSPGANGPMVQALQDLGWLKTGGEAT